jgi:hypothetical protein
MPWARSAASPAKSALLAAGHPQVSANELMDRSWQKLLVNMMKGKGSTAQQARM